jgi:hypothetical protein
MKQQKKISVNRLHINSPIFGLRKEKVKWPTIRHAYMTDENVPLLKEFVTKKGRSIIFLDGKYHTTLNRYKNLPSEERAVSWEFMCREKGVKGGIFMLCWLGNFHNGCIFHASPQFPQIQCWYEQLGFHKANEFFERQSFKIYETVVSIVSNGGPIIDNEVRDFIDNGRKLLNGSL